MYDWDEVRSRTDAFWERLRYALAAQWIDAPARLSRQDDIKASWTDPDLLIGQTCGLPYVSGHCGNAVVIGRPDYGFEGASGGAYTSVLVCRKEDTGDLAAFRRRRAAVNDTNSQSGHNALADEIQRQKLDDERGFFGEIVFSGSHRASARMVAEREADIAAIDAVAWALFAELEPVRHARLRVIRRTRTMPALPFITSRQNAHLGPAIFKALLEACEPAGPPIPGIPALVVPADDADYDPVRQMARRLVGFRLGKNVKAIKAL